MYRGASRRTSVEYFFGSCAFVAPVIDSRGIDIFDIDFLGQDKQNLPLFTICDFLLTIVRGLREPREQGAGDQGSRESVTKSVVISNIEQGTSNVTV